MKKFIFSSILVLFACVILSAQERVLFEASKLSDATYSSDKVQTDNSADKWYADFGSQGVGKSAFTYTLIKGAGDRGLGIKVEIPSRYWDGKYVSVVLKPNILPSLTENESGNGRLTNVGDVKSVTVKGYTLGFDLSVRPVMMMSDGTKVGMRRLDVERMNSSFEVRWDNPGYIEDVNKRNIKVRPVYPNTINDLLLEGIEVRGKPYYPTTDGPGYLIVYLNTVTVVADKAYEELDNFSEELWGIEGGNTNKMKLRQEKELEQRELQKAQMAALKAEPTEEASN